MGFNLKNAFQAIACKNTGEVLEYSGIIIVDDDDANIRSIDFERRKTKTLLLKAQKRWANVVNELKIIKIQPTKWILTLPFNISA